jgi:hypothetical protein
MAEARIDFLQTFLESIYLRSELAADVRKLCGLRTLIELAAREHAIPCPYFPFLPNNPRRKTSQHTKQPSGEKHHD